MFDVAVKQFDRVLGNLDSILTKAEKYAEAKKFDVNHFCQSRLAPDMFNFVKQIQIACDTAKGCVAAIGGVEAPKFDDNETNFSELHARVAKTRAFISSVPHAKIIDADPNKKVALLYPQGKFMILKDRVFTNAIPNFYFHISMAYALLRQGGVEIGKGDFLGTLNILDA